MHSLGQAQSKAFIEYTCEPVFLDCSTCVMIVTHVRERPEGIGFSGDGIIDACELPSVVAGN